MNKGSVTLHNVVETAGDLESGPGLVRLVHPLLAGRLVHVTPLLLTLRFIFFICEIALQG